jgi:hypothetical protein
MNPLPALLTFAILAGIMFLIMRRNRDRERTVNAPLRGEVQAGVRFATRLDHVRILGTGGVGGTRGQWIDKRGPKRLVVGADAFTIEAFREYVFTGRESSIRFSQAPSRLVQRDWIVITGLAGGRQVQLAITKKAGLPEIWQALAGAGAAQDWGPPAGAPG